MRMSRGLVLTAVVLVALLATGLGAAGSERTAQGGQKGPQVQQDQDFDRQQQGNQQGQKR